MNKFKVGDLVKGINGPYVDYTVTTNEAKMKVTDVNGNRQEDLIVELVESLTHPHLIGHRYTVSSKFFKHVKPISLENK